MMRTSLWTSSFLTAFVIGVLASSGGCKLDPGECEIHHCATGTQLWACKPITGGWKYQCKGSEADADHWCQGIAGKQAVFMACDGYGGDESETGAGAPPWDPSSYVSVDSNGHYLVDEAFAAILKADPGLILLDSARVDLNSVGYLELESVAQGDLADVLGLQSGDALVSVNSYSLSSLDDLADAYSALENATTFVLTISRNGQPMTLTYVVN